MKQLGNNNFDRYMIENNNFLNIWCVNVPFIIEQKIIKLGSNTSLFLNSNESRILDYLVSPSLTLFNNLSCYFFKY